MLKHFFYKLIVLSELLNVLFLLFILNSHAQVDTTPPVITVNQPIDLEVLNSRKVSVQGVVDGTGSKVDEVLVNGKQVNLSTKNQPSNTARFSENVNFSGDGTFQILVKAADKAGNLSEKSITFTIDTTNPTVNATIDSNADGSYQINGTANGTGSDVVSIEINNAAVTITQEPTVTFSVRINTSTAQIKVTDKAGNKITALVKVINTTPPDITILSPLENDAFNKLLIPVTGTVDGTGVPVKRVLVNSQAATLNPTSHPNIVDFSENITFTMDGLNTITIFAEDNSLNTAQKSLMVIIDLLIPSITGLIEVTDEQQTKVSGMADDTGSNVVSVNINGTELKITEGLNVDFEHIIDTDLASIKVKDKAGNEATASFKASDIIPPVITIDSPIESMIYNSRRIMAIGTIDGTNSLVSSLLINSNSVILIPIDTNVVRFNHDVVFDNDGLFEINLEARDTANNKVKKTIKGFIDTVNPEATIDIETITSENFKITGTAKGTGSNVFSIFINKNPVTFTPQEEVNFTISVDSKPVNIIIFDEAGNKLEQTISGPIGGDITPPVITFQTPTNGELFSMSSITVSFTVTDDISVKQVLFNREAILPVGGTQYFKDVNLFAGENIFNVTAFDQNDNKSVLGIKAVFLPSQLPPELTGIPPAFTEDESKDNFVINLPSPDQNSTLNPNESVIDGFININLPDSTLPVVDIPSSGPIEIANPPIVPDDVFGEIVLLPEIEGLDFTRETDPLMGLTLPRDCSFATVISLKEEDLLIDESGSDKQFSSLLIDGVGRTFVSGFGFFREALERIPVQRKYSFQTDSGNNLDLIITITIPKEAKEGDAKIVILNKDKSLVTVPIKIGPIVDVKVGKKKRKNINVPEIKAPLSAKVLKLEKSNLFKLKVSVKGNNLLRKFAVINGKPLRLAGKGNVFTSVSFVPPEEINVKKIRFPKKKRSKFKFVSDLSNDLKPGIKLFNVITPKCADIGGIVIPEEITPGEIEGLASPEGLILEDLIRKKDEQQD